MAASGPITLQTLQRFAQRNQALADDDEAGRSGAAADGADGAGGDAPMAPDLTLNSDEEQELVVKTQKKRQTRPRLTQANLLQERGVDALYEKFPELPLREGTGSEAANLKMLINEYKKWAFGVFPRLCLEDFTEELRGLSYAKKGAMLQQHLDFMRQHEGNRRLGVAGIAMHQVREHSESLRLDLAAAEARQLGEDAPMDADRAAGAGEAEAGAGGGMGGGMGAGIGSGTGDAVLSDDDMPTPPAAMAPAPPAWEEDLVLRDDDLAMLEALESRLVPAADA